MQDIFLKISQIPFRVRNCHLRLLSIFFLNSSLTKSYLVDNLLTMLRPIRAHQNNVTFVGFGLHFGNIYGNPAHYLE
jgi:hypothetical protein